MSDLSPTPPPTQAMLRDRLLDAYLCGALDPALALLAETQAALTPAMGGVLDTADAAAGAWLEAEAPAAMGEGALAAVFAAIDSARGAPALSPQTAPTDLPPLPKALEGIALEGLAAGGWRFAAPGVRRLRLPVAGAAKAELLRIEPGAGVARHDHRGDELTLVLTGSFIDERGRYGPAEIAFGRPGETHAPRAGEGEVCYALAVTTGGLEFVGLLGVLQRLTGR